MPRHKHTEGGAAVLEPRERGLSTREALRLLYTMEDLAECVVRARPTAKTRQALARVKTLREELEERFDNEEADKALLEPGRIPWEEVKKKAGL